MQKIQDRLFLGLVAGFGANLIKEIIAETAIRSGISKYSCRRIIPHIVMDPKDAKTWKGWVVGTTTDFTVAGLIGILTVYTLTNTGKDYKFIKGIMLSNGILDQVFNMFSVKLPKVKKDPNSNLLCKGIHTVFGVTAASIITNMGDPNLFKKNNP